jgi:hypothetical protein
LPSQRLEGKFHDDRGSVLGGKLVEVVTATGAMVKEITVPVRSTSAEFRVVTDSCLVEMNWQPAPG